VGGEGVKMKNEKPLTRVCAYARERVRAQVMNDEEEGGREVRKNGEESAKNGLF